MTNTPIKSFEMLSIQEARKSILKDHPARKMYKLPRETNVFVFTSERDAEYFVIAKELQVSVWRDKDDPKYRGNCRLPPIYCPKR